MTRNLSGNQAQALQPILRGKNNNNNKEIIVSGVSLEGFPTYNPKLKYTHAVTHDTTTLKDPVPWPAAPMP